VSFLKLNSDDFKHLKNEALRFNKIIDLIEDIEKNPIKSKEKKNEDFKLREQFNNYLEYKRLNHTGKKHFRGREND
jgi:Txe/YoeB family toxin of Txe-Axe toxin-antitoxin module